MSDPSKNSIIWLEDNPEDDLIDIMDYIGERYTLRLAGGLVDLRNEIDNSKECNENIKGIILDMMIHGLHDLEAFDRSDISWLIGSRVGELVLKYVFRNKDKQWEYLNAIPILILSVKSDILHNEFIEYGDNISVIQKYDDNHWIEDVKKWITNQKPIK